MQVSYIYNYYNLYQIYIKTITKRKTKANTHTQKHHTQKEQTQSTFSPFLKQKGKTIKNGSNDKELKKTNALYFVDLLVSVYPLPKSKQALRNLTTYYYY